MYTACEHRPNGSLAPYDAPCLLCRTENDVLTEKLDKIDQQQQAILESMTAIENMVRTVVAEVKPTLDSLMSNPMLRMALGIKR